MEIDRYAIPTFHLTLKIQISKDQQSTISSRRTHHVSTMECVHCSLQVCILWFLKCTAAENCRLIRTNLIVGGELSVFPNSEEKFQHLLHNLDRMHPNQSLYTPLGKWMYGTHGEATRCPRGSYYCGNERDSNLMPLYWYSPSNTMARFKQWDEKTCDQSWYDESQQTLHSTCGWGEEITIWGADGYCDNEACTTLSNRCSYFTEDPDSNQGCEYSDRAQYYNVDDNDDAWWEKEALCAGNSCFDTTGHSDPIFQSVFEYVGKGFVEGTNGVDSVYSRSTREIYYELVMGMFTVIYCQCAHDV